MEKMKVYKDGVPTRISSLGTNISFQKRQFKAAVRLPHRKKLYSAREIVEKIDKSKGISGQKTRKDNQGSHDTRFPGLSSSESRIPQ